VTSSSVCEHARAQISLELDGELSQLGRAMVRAHLLRCARCRAFAGDVGAFTRQLRAAPFEQLSRPLPVFRAHAGRFGRTTRAISQVGVAAVFVLATVGITRQVEWGHSPPTRLGAQDLFATAWTPDVELEQLATGAPKKWRVGTRHGVRFTT
jgi:predicted anti-sigma-YlaC factor YlaD